MLSPASRSGSRSPGAIGRSIRRKYEVANGDTVLGFSEWVEAQNAATATDPLLPCDTVTFGMTRSGGKQITVDLRSGEILEGPDEDELWLYEIDLFRAGEYVTTYNPDEEILPEDRDVVERAAKLAGVFVPMLEEVTYASAETLRELAANSDDEEEYHEGEYEEESNEDEDEDSEELLVARDPVTAPAILAQLDCTTVIRPGQVGRIDEWKNVIVTQDG